jgi:hypothetical protein
MAIVCPAVGEFIDLDPEYVMTGVGRVWCGALRKG